MSHPEFDPTSEYHYPLLAIKAVEPGCTTELQIENALTGEVRRFTTTECGEQDDELFEREVLAAFRSVWFDYCKKVTQEVECPTRKSPKP